MGPLICYVNGRQRRHGAGKTAAAGEREPSDKFRAAGGIKAVGWVDAPDREGTDPELIGGKEAEDVSAKNLLCVQAVVPGDRVGLGTLEGREHHRRKVRIAGADSVAKQNDISKCVSSTLNRKAFAGCRSESSSSEIVRLRNRQPVGG